MLRYLVFILKGFAKESKKHTIVCNGLQGEGILLGLLNHISMALTTIKFLLLLGLLLRGSYQRAITCTEREKSLSRTILWIHWKYRNGDSW
jgi:hypothetical protein